MNFSPHPTRFASVAILLLGLQLTRTSARAQVSPTYSHGDPSAQEQLLLELVNRARANPSAEGVRLGRAQEFAGYAARPPLAFHAALMNAARGHNEDMAAANFFSHSGSDGSQPGDRAVAAGYSGAAYSVGENLSYGFNSPQAAEEALMIDDGVPGLEHRDNYLGLGQFTRLHRETGIAFDLDSRALNTQMFAERGVGLITGVAFQDADGDNFYSPGEGVGGVTVSSPQSTFATTTSGSGGYALPLDNVRDLAAGTTIVFREASGASYTRRLPLASTIGDGVPDNVKADLRVGTDVPDAGTGSVRLQVGQGTGIAASGQKPTVIFTRAGSDLSAPVTVNYKVAGSAVGGVDYKTLPGFLTIPAGSATATLKIKVRDRADFPPKVKVKLTVLPGNGYVVGTPAKVVVVILSGR